MVQAAQCAVVRSAFSETILTTWRCLDYSGFVPSLVSCLDVYVSENVRQWIWVILLSPGIAGKASNDCQQQMEQTSTSVARSVSKIPPKDLPKVANLLSSQIHRNHSSKQSCAVIFLHPLIRLQFRDHTPKAQLSVLHIHDPTQSSV